MGQHCNEHADGQRHAPKVHAAGTVAFLDNVPGQGFVEVKAQEDVFGTSGPIEDAANMRLLAESSPLVGGLHTKSLRQLSSSSTLWLIEACGPGCMLLCHMHGSRSLATNAVAFGWRLGCSAVIISWRGTCWSTASRCGARLGHHLALGQGQGPDGRPRRQQQLLFPP
eukprot:5713769-Amphidinium_carterae.2